MLTGQKGLPLSVALHGNQSESEELPSCTCMLELGNAQTYRVYCGNPLLVQCEQLMHLLNLLGCFLKTCQCSLLLCMSCL